MLLTAALLGLLALAAPGGVRADQEQERLEAVRRSLAEAERQRDLLSQEEAALKAEITALTEKMVQLARTLQEREAKLTRIEMEIDLLEEQRLVQETALDARRAQLARTLAALQQLTRQPPQLLLLRPASAVDRARSAGLLAQVLPALEEDAATIRADLVSLHAVRAELDQEQARGRDAVAALTVSRVEMEALHAARAERRDAVAEQGAETQQRLAALAAQAKSLEELIAKLEAERARIAATPKPKLKPEERPFAEAPPRSTAKPFSGARGALPLPAQGDLVAGFGAETSEGSSKGISIATRAQAQVVSPYDGQVVFADRFRSYGRLLIITHGEGYHSLLAGMERFDVRVGQWVLAGEPVGQMGDNAALADGGPRVDARPVLYMELQRGGKPINPLPWLSARLGKGK